MHYFAYSNIKLYSCLTKERNWLFYHSQDLFTRVVSTRNYFLNKICVKNQFVLKEFYKKILWSRTINDQQYCQLWHIWRPTVSIIMRFSVKSRTPDDLYIQISARIQMIYPKSRECYTKNIPHSFSLHDFWLSISVWLLISATFSNIMFLFFSA